MGRFVDGLLDGNAIKRPDATSLTICTVPGPTNLLRVEVNVNGVCDQQKKNNSLIIRGFYLFGKQSQGSFEGHDNTIHYGITLYH